MVVAMKRRMEGRMEGGKRSRVEGEQMMVDSDGEGEM